MKYTSINEEEEESMLPSSSSSPPLTFTQKLVLLPSLMQYMIPVFLVYLAEYVINQGLVSVLTSLCNMILNILKQKQQQNYTSGIFTMNKLEF